MLAWLSVWSEVQTWPSGCHWHSLSLASVKSRLVLPFWYRLTWVVPERAVKRCVLNGVYIATDGVAWSVYMLISCHSRDPCQDVWAKRAAFWGETHMSPRNSVWDGGPGLPVGRGTFWDTVMPLVFASCLIHEFCEPNKTVKLNSTNTDILPTLISINVENLWLAHH